MKQQQTLFEVLEYKVNEKRTKIPIEYVTEKLSKNINKSTRSMDKKYINSYVLKYVQWHRVGVAL